MASRRQYDCCLRTLFSLSPFVLLVLLLPMSNFLVLHDANPGLVGRISVRCDEGKPQCCARSTPPFSVAGRDTTRGWAACVRVMDTFASHRFPLFCFGSWIVVWWLWLESYPRFWSTREVQGKTWLNFLIWATANTRSLFLSDLGLFLSLCCLYMAVMINISSKHASSASENSWLKNLLYRSEPWSIIYFSFLLCFITVFSFDCCRV